MVVPMRGLAAGKSRLASVMGSTQRTRLNTQWLDRVLDAFAAVQGHAGQCLVVSPSQDALAHARKRGLCALSEAGGGDLNGAVEHACAHAQGLGATRILILAADLPLASELALRRLVVETPTEAVALVADKHGQGTNGILLPANAARGFSFGEGSLSRHQTRFEREGLVVLIWRDEALAFDIDTPDDLASWRATARPAA